MTPLTSFLNRSASSLVLALCLVAPTAVPAAQPALNPCEKCMASANDDYNACVKSRGPQEKSACGKLMSEQVKKCQPACKKPGEK
jgi:hypothetical protein